jgi:crotonobetainyl-CoA:carnitine CoA-transferase CaiB-like acyl-CoA transferase
VKIDSAIGEHYLAGAPFHLNKINDESFKLKSAPKLGAHTNILLNELGYAKEEIIALFRAKIVG